MLKLRWFVAVLLCGMGVVHSARGQSLTPIAGLERSQVNAQIFEPRRVPSASEGIQHEEGAGEGAATGQPSAGGGIGEPEGAAGAAGGALGEGLVAAFVPQSLQLRVGLSVRSEYNTNVTVAGNQSAGRAAAGKRKAGTAAASEDLITSAVVNLTVQSRFAGGRSIGLNLALGYEQYLANPEFSGPIINATAPGGLAFRFSTGEVHWTLFDHFSFTNDAADEPELSGVTDFSRFSNSAGAEAAWAPSEFLLLKAGYTRSNTISSATEAGTQDPSQDETEQDQASDAFQLTAIHPLNAMLQAGLSASATFTKQSGARGSDSTSYGIGPFLSGQITHATDLLITAGVQTMTFEQDASQSPGFPAETESSDGQSWYGKVQLNNQLTHFYSHSLAVGRDTRAGLLSDSVTTEYVRYSNSLRIGQQAMLSGNVFADRSQQSGGEIGERFTRTGGGVSLSVPLRPTVGATLGWQYLRKSSDDEERSYSQHRVFASLSWYF